MTLFWDFSVWLKNADTVIKVMFVLLLVFSAILMRPETLLTDRTKEKNGMNRTKKVRKWREARFLRYRHTYLQLLDKESQRLPTQFQMCAMSKVMMSGLNNGKKC